MNCKKLIVTHHSPFKTDDELRRFERLAREVYPSTDFARSGQHWEFPYTEKGDTYEESAEKRRGLKWLEGIQEQFNTLLLDSKQLSSVLGFGTYILLGCVSLFMTIVNVLTGKTLLMYSTLIFALLCAMDAILEVKVKHWHKGIQMFFQMQFLALLTFFVVAGTPEGFSAIWSLLLPVGGMLVFGKRRTSILSSIMLCILLFFLDTPLGQNYLQYEYTASFRLRFPMAFCAFFALAFFLETVRERLRETQAETIANQTAELRAQYFDIVRANSQLQLRNKALRNMIGSELSDDEILQMLEPADKEAEHSGV